jgi:hypothetical protein
MNSPSSNSFRWLMMVAPNHSAFNELALTRLPITVQFPRQFINYSGFGWPGVGDPALRRTIYAITNDAIYTHPSYAQHNAEYGEAHTTRFGGANEATARLILSHLWTVWRDEVELSIVVPYLFGFQGRRNLHYYAVTDFLPQFNYSTGVLEHEARMKKLYNREVSILKGDNDHGY